VVDDNVDAAEALAILLESEGHEVRTEFSGAAALSAAAGFRPDLVICDIGLPGMSGYDVARAAPSVHRPELMLAVTGYGSAEDRTNALAAGFDGHLAKPVAVSDLLREVSVVTPG